ncbi:hypothetical protein Dsin_001141, partial [Dipteronia sinensis]
MVPLSTLHSPLSPTTSFSFTPNAVVFIQTYYPNVFSSNVLIAAYTKEFAAFTKELRLNISHQLFDQIPQPDSVS